MNENENADFGGLTFCEEPGFNGQSSKPNTSTTMDSGSNYTKDTPDFNVTDTTSFDTSTPDTSSFDTTYTFTPDTSSYESSYTDTSSFDTTYTTTPDTSSYESSYTDTSSYESGYTTTTDTSDYYGSAITETSTASSNSSGLSLNTESVKSSGLSLNTESAKSSGLSLNTESVKSSGLSLNADSAESSTSTESSGLNLNTASAETNSFSAKPENNAGPAFTAAAAVASTFTEPEPAVDPVKPYTPAPDSSANVGNSFDNFDEPFVTTSTSTSSGPRKALSFREYYSTECPFEKRRKINATCIGIYLILAANWLLCSIYSQISVSLSPKAYFTVSLIPLVLAITIHVTQNKACGIILFIVSILFFPFTAKWYIALGLIASCWSAFKATDDVLYAYNDYTRKNS